MLGNPKSQTGKVAVIYARVSSERQAEEGFSIHAQLDLLREYASGNGFSVAEEYVDQETAKTTGRTSFGKMIHFLKANSVVRNILVEKTDRLYRNFRDYVDLEDLDVNIHLVKEAEVLNKNSSSHTKFIHGIKALMAKNYLDNLSEEVKKGMDKKADNGEWPSKPPLGYTRNTDDHLIYPDPERTQLVLRLFREYASGSHSLKSLTGLARNIGLRSMTGKPVNKAGIHRILTNLLYTGKFFVYKDKLHDNGVHEPVVSLDLFQTVQRVLNGGTTPKQTKRNFAFRGIVKCHRCGCSMTPDIKKGKYIYYRCTEFKGKCSNSITEQKLVDLLANTVRRIQISPMVAEGLKVALRESQADKEVYHREALKALRARYDRVSGYLETAYEDRVDGTIDDRLWKKKSAGWNTELQDIEAQIEIHRRANLQYLDLGNQIIELARDAYDLYLQQSNQDRCRLLNYLLSNCTYADGTLYATYRKPFDAFAEGSEMKIKRG